MKESDLILRDHLAIERTKLANERTFLAYFRSSIFFLATGISIIHINFFSEVNFLGWLFVGISPTLLSIGFIRLVIVRKTVNKMVEKSDN